MSLIFAAWTPGSIGAAPSAESAKDDFKIDSQPLATALQELAKQSGVQIVFFSQITEGLRAPALKGQYTLLGALETLLAGSRLTFRVIDRHTIEIRSQTASDSAGATAASAAEPRTTGAQATQPPRR